MACWRRHGARRPETCTGGTPVGDPRTGTSEAQQDHRARGVLVRRDLVDRVRDGRDSVRHRDRREPRGRSRLPGPDRDCGGRPARDRHHVVSPDDQGVSAGRCGVHREPRQPRRDGVARRGRVDSRRLHPHRRSIDLGRHRRHHLDSCVSRRDARLPRRDLSRVRRAHCAPEPARLEGVGPRLRGAYLRLHRHAVADVVPGLDEVLPRVVRRYRSGAVRSGARGRGRQANGRRSFADRSRRTRRARSPRWA
jgi:hypothetical protein